MSKPSWKEAPEWAMFLAQNEDGWWSWWDRKPVVCEIAKCWNQDGPVSDSKYRYIYAGSVFGEWTESLEARPAHD